MRLACPNCGAEYEVPEGLIPEGGKHVQCTDCETRWFVRGGRDAVVSEDQLIERLENWRPRLVSGGPPPPDADAAEPAAPAAPPELEPRPSEPEPAPVAEPEPEPEPAPPSPETSTNPGEDARVDAMPDLEDDGPPEDFVWEVSHGEVAPSDPVPAARGPARPTPPPAPPAAAPMFQPVRPPDPVTAPERPAAPVTGTDPGPAAAAANVTTSETGADHEDARPVRERTRNSHRIELPEDGARPAEVSGSPSETGRFRTGMLVALALFALALVAYAGRETIGGAVPALGPALDGYAGAVDGLRERVDRIIAPDG